MVDSMTVAGMFKVLKASKDFFSKPQTPTAPSRPFAPAPFLEEPLVVDSMTVAVILEVSGRVAGGTPTVGLPLVLGGWGSESGVWCKR